MGAWPDRVHRGPHHGRDRGRPAIEAAAFAAPPPRSCLAAERCRRRRRPAPGGLLGVAVPAAGALGCRSPAVLHRPRPAGGRRRGGKEPGTSEPRRRPERPESIGSVTVLRTPRASRWPGSPPYPDEVELQRVVRGPLAAGAGTGTRPRLGITGRAGHDHAPPTAPPRPPTMGTPCTPTSVTRAPGQASGNGLGLNGGLWHEITPPPPPVSADTRYQGRAVLRRAALGARRIRRVGCPDRPGCSAPAAGVRGGGYSARGSPALSAETGPSRSVPAPTLSPQPDLGDALDRIHCDSGTH